MAATNGTAPKITLYTNHRCPWAHRAHIVIKELGLPYDEVIIDLDKPREKWYLEVNPRGLVPSIKFSGGALHDEIITESGIVAQFLADAYPSHLVPATGTVEAALTRARINFFVDTWFSKAGSFWFQILMKDAEEEKEALAKEFLDIVTKEIEPLLKDAGPFFGGSQKLTLAEALTAPFILRIYSMGNNGLIPQSLLAGFNGLPNFSKWAAEVIKQDSVTYIWDEQATLEGTKRKLASLKAK
ncbi:glutathione-S-transferas-like protein omega 1 [Lindgomyces ingoldianus]|uniref:Glutathione-S-transferas-like protein omega 1 n=1 Tax=Lindgomyces ingoldianus TaxID=673940 RepID=A0ACB6QEQ3_9PLEO|nr:glutathione-S-transferas-like protein omega 1 [Lindgomyces ingoldianus]KAF2465463.1 glutathione-S-transferas-like protein omega 1 [Lindgomyces ingoldianus]